MPAGAGPAVRGSPYGSSRTAVGGGPGLGDREQWRAGEIGEGARPGAVGAEARGGVARQVVAHPVGQDAGLRRAQVEVERGRLAVDGLGQAVAGTVEGVGRGDEEREGKRKGEEWDPLS